MKRRSSVGAIPTQSLLDFDLGESSSDSDFRIEDHDEESDDSSVNSDKSDNDSDDDSDDEDDDDDDDDDDESDNDFNIFKSSFTETQGAGQDLTAEQVLAQAKAKDALERANAKMLATPICCACLGDRSDDTNEIVECDNCGISVHEGCYGISDSNSVSSTVSSCSTEPWFCEACKANVIDPSCELCPNKGGIFKETDVGKWVHLVCALYVPGVAFGEVDQLSSVTLFEMPYNKWGAKICSLCEDARFARCGVCIGCDAGMCKTYFHVTCAQSAGLLSETHSEEADHADPFYAHCKIHSDKTLIKHRKRNFNALKMKMEYRKMNAEQKKMENSSPGQQRIERKLKKHRNKYIAYKAQKAEPWVPTQKMPRLLSTSASACRRLILKAELMGIDAAALEFQEAQMASLADVRKKWHIPPAFSVEFIGYYLDRISRTKEIKSSLQHELQLNKTLVNDQQVLRNKYDEAIKVHTEASVLKTSITEAIEKLHLTIHTLCPNKTLPSLEYIGQPTTIASPAVAVQPVSRPMSVPTAAALKMGVGFPLTNLPGTKEDPNRILSTQCQNKSELLYECGICKHVNDQHLLAKCDTCQLHYHLGCLTPPLTRHPKKSKIYGWQCSECDEDNPDGVVTLTSGPRKSRTKYSKDGTIVPVDSSNDVSLDNIKEDEKVPSTSPTVDSAKKQKPAISHSNKKSNKKSNKNADDSETTEQSTNNLEEEQMNLSVKSPEINAKIKSPRRNVALIEQMNVSVKSPERNATIKSPRRNTAPIEQMNVSVKSPERNAMIKSPRRNTALIEQMNVSVKSPERNATIKSPRRNTALIEQMNVSVKSPERNATNKSPRRNTALIEQMNASVKSPERNATNKSPRRNTALIEQMNVSVKSPERNATNKSPRRNTALIEQMNVSVKSPERNATIKSPRRNTALIEQMNVSVKSPERNATNKSPKRNISVKSPNPMCKSPVTLSTSEQPKALIKQKESKKKEKTKSKTAKATHSEPAAPSPNNPTIENGTAQSLKAETKPTEIKTKINIKLNNLDKTKPNATVVKSPTAKSVPSTPVTPASDTLPESESSPQPPAPKVKISKKSKKLHVSKLKTEHNETNGSSTSENKAPSLIIKAGVMQRNVESTSQNTNLKSEATELTTLTNGVKSNDEIDATHKQNRKRRKEKRRSKHNAERERSSSKEHKKKRKRKNHDIENPNTMSNAADGVPKIKIKFKALPLPGETATESHFFYVPANMVRPRDFSRSRPASVDSNDENTSNSVPQESPTRVLSPSRSSFARSPTRSIMRTRRISVLLSPPRSIARQAITPTTVANSINAAENQTCDVCQVIGTNQDLVKCDECRKNYHFRCLEPPLKKTPKRRGYSWHCADCDPTDKEDN